MIVEVEAVEVYRVLPTETNFLILNPLLPLVTHFKIQARLTIHRQGQQQIL